MNFRKNSFSKDTLPPIMSCQICLEDFQTLVSCEACSQEYCLRCQLETTACPFCRATPSSRWMTVFENIGWCKNYLAQKDATVFKRTRLLLVLIGLTPYPTEGGGERSEYRVEDVEPYRKRIKDILKYAEQEDLTDALFSAIKDYVYNNFLIDGEFDHFFDIYSWLAAYREDPDEFEDDMWRDYWSQFDKVDIPKKSYSRRTRERFPKTKRIPVSARVYTRFRR